ncbi:hypothetical protein BOV88_07415 [Solemya velum gill symbiont]|uniref:Anti sigma-E protein RseA N-terminal domain-containing protein n=1 Tax=Solemya velum gill symbiont TaxID=2340 RepID=A0A1T2D3E3_SOVGS|nr:sigma-E factor negative regulatory protein [Solemya velum gill symbiont]OOY34938.1 hypothetical protein BOV88_07415 [Solemya velum gill symbiont]OOY41618.1 hypothetical protein BOV91_10535 [Solemya velum gill symbiont]OOY47260.1 hypothetical protein BOV93_07170 [Solemya velum gill symbiont]
MKKMTNPEPEQLSALLDGEISYKDGKQLVDSLLSREEAKATLARYQTVRACLNGETAEINHVDLFESIHNQLAEEPVILAPAAIKGGISQGIKRFASGGALAAGVAAAVIFGVNSLSTNVQEPAFVANSGNAPAVVMAPTTVSSPADAEQPSSDRHGLEIYLEEHESLSRGSFGTGLPLATMVGYEGF